MRTYPDFKSVPEGSKCRPYFIDRDLGHEFHKKEMWTDPEYRFLLSSKAALGEWQVAPPTVTITADDFDNAVDRVSRITGYTEAQRLQHLKGELFREGGK